MAARVDEVIRALCAGLIILPVTLAAACGDAPSQLPEPAPCVAPTSTPIPGARGAGIAVGSYRQTVSRGVDRLHELTDQFRQKWPGGKFSRDGAFRTDFAAM